ncbi:hypothetical protein MmiHf6_04470 [Methanimicrococcus hongohii]|uniref:Uncharacterized protein n=1 Tax=Methanimicrococcus hongohii TaxID=3028295 RepID=A0AA96UYW0_9EURY|nr:hypothetical protein [Methanimicrococcus sp. Hf6]WNY23144.1 hypothetical protein MmiHf6_04470 [Methanimicrococcus sp. Hf6]
MDENTILTAFSILLIFWFIIFIAREIFLSSRGRKVSAEKQLYFGLIFSIAASLLLTLYLASLQNAFNFNFILLTFAGVFVLWILPVFIALIIYFVYFKTKRYEFKEAPEIDKKAETLKKYNESFNSENKK